LPTDAVLSWENSENEIFRATDPAGGAYGGPQPPCWIKGSLPLRENEKGRRRGNK